MTDLWRVDGGKPRAGRHYPVTPYQFASWFSRRARTYLTAGGLTNRDIASRRFVSRHTVDFHLRQIFRKLLIRSRAELIRLATERENATA